MLRREVRSASGPPRASLIVVVNLVLGDGSRPRRKRQRERRRPVVLFEHDVATANCAENPYGVQFFLTSRDFGLRPDRGSGLNIKAVQPPTVDASGVANAFLNRAFPGFNFLVGPEAQPRLILDALHAITSVKVLSNPSLVVIDYQPATFQVGDQVPVSTGSATVLSSSNTIVNTIDYRDTGIILRVVPRVLKLLPSPRSAVTRHTAGLPGRHFRPTSRLPFGLFLAPAIWFGWFLETLWSAP